MLLIILAAVQIDAHARELHARLVREALRLADISIEKAALYMAIDRAQFDRQLQGDGHVSFTRLMALPEEFWRWFYLLGAELAGIPEVVTRSARLRLALKARRQLKAHSVSAAERKLA